MSTICIASWQWSQLENKAADKDVFCIQCSISNVAMMSHIPENCMLSNWHEDKDAPILIENRAFLPKSIKGTSRTNVLVLDREFSPFLVRAPTLELLLSWPSVITAITG
jgi:hypothetical protein